MPSFPRCDQQVPTVATWAICQVATRDTRDSRLKTEILAQRFFTDTYDIRRPHLALMRFARLTLRRNKENLLTLQEQYICVRDNLGRWDWRETRCVTRKLLIIPSVAIIRRANAIAALRISVTHLYEMRDKRTPRSFYRSATVTYLELSETRGERRKTEARGWRVRERLDERRHGSRLFRWASIRALWI